MQLARNSKQKTTYSNSRRLAVDREWQPTNAARVTRAKDLLSAVLHTVYGVVSITLTIFVLDNCTAVGRFFNAVHLLRHHTFVCQP